MLGIFYDSTLHLMLEITIAKHQVTHDVIHRPVSVLQCNVLKNN